MAMTDPDSGITIDPAYALDSHAAVAGEDSIWTDAANLVAKGIPLTGAAIANSFINTPIEVANWMGAGLDKIGIQDEFDSDMTDYYNQHSTGIEAAALAIGSLAPGLGAIKGASAAIKASAMMKAGYSTEIMSQATGLLAPLKARVIAGALSDIQDAGALSNTLQTAKYQMFALNVADNALQGLLFETATTATMKASPLLDNDSLGDITQNLATAALTGGVLGGAVDSYLSARFLGKAASGVEDAAQNAYGNITYLGGKDTMVNGGDRAASILDSMDKLPAPGASEPVGRRVYATTMQNAELALKGSLGQLVQTGDEDLSNGLADMLLTARASGAITTDDALNTMTRLASIDRVGAQVDQRTGPVFYVNKFLKSNPYAGQATIDDLVTSTPQDLAAGGRADLSRAYMLAPGVGADDLSIVHATDSFTVPGTTLDVPLYNKVGDAWAAGHDVFIDKNNLVHINPDSDSIVGKVARPGESRILSPAEEQAYRNTTVGNLPADSEPLYTAPMYANLLSGEVTAPAAFNPITGEASPGITRVVGDLGTPKVTDVGVVAGGKTFLNSVGSGLIDGNTTTEAATARYVWAADRGLKSGDTIAANDIPMLEQMYREASNPDVPYEETLARWDRRSISIDGEETPGSLSDLKSRVQQAKDEFITDNLGTSSNVSSRDIAAKANVPESYILHSLNSDDFMAPIENLRRVNTVQLQYNLGNTFLRNDGMIAQGMIDHQYRVQLIQDAAHSASAAYFGDAVDDMTIRRSAQSTSSAGTGAGFLSFANSGYNTVGQEMERTGRTLTEWSRKSMEKIHATLSVPINSLRTDPVAAAELNAFVNVRRSTSETYTFLPPELAAQYKVSSNTAVLTRSLVKDRTGAIVDWDQNFTPANFMSNASKYWETGSRQITPQLTKQLHTSYELSQKVADFERAHQAINDARNVNRNNWMDVQGLTQQRLPVGTLYAPPVNVEKYPFFAMIRERPGMGNADGGVGIITAASARELEQKVAGFRDNYQVIYKQDIKNYHQVLGDYQFQRNFADSRINQEMRRQGVLNNIFPESNIESTIKDYIGFHSNQDIRLARDYTELNNAQFYAELQARGSAYASAQTSKRGGLLSSLRTGGNPFDTYRNTSLAITSKENYPLWFDAQQKVEQFFDTAFQTAKDAFFATKKNLLPYDQAAAMSEQMGLGRVYETAVDRLKAYSDTAYTVPKTPWMSNFLSGAHSILAASYLRLDAFQALINVVSTPVLMLPEAQAAIKAGKEFITQTLPDGSGKATPSILKLLHGGVTSFMSPADPERIQLMGMLKRIQAVRDNSSEYFQMLKELELPNPNSTSAQISAALSKASDIGAKYTGNKLAETMSRYVPGYMAYKIFSDAGMSGQQLEDNVATFVNRVQGNYIASQRPIAFQGPIGGAISLFQTYQVNLLQQLLRHVAEGNGKALATMAGAQVSLFGMNGLPGFQMLNQAIVGNAAGNPSHADAYSILPSWAGNQLGKWLMFGGLSNVTQEGLYSRGDINPRQISILPINPMDWPAISGGVKVASNLIDVASKIANGGSVPASIMLGLEHNSLSRPLAGLAQIAQGFSTTGQGNLVATTRNGWNDLISAANFGRLLGARPLDEAVVMDAKYRNSVYQAADTTRKAALGAAVKTDLYGNQEVSPEAAANFARIYASIGGQQNSFAREMVQWSKDANAGTANDMFKKLATPAVQQMQRAMGGQPLTTFANQQQAPSQQQTMSGARRAGDGQLYMPDPNNPGGYLKVGE